MTKQEEFNQKLTEIMNTLTSIITDKRKNEQSFNITERAKERINYIRQKDDHNYIMHDGKTIKDIDGASLDKRKAKKIKGVKV